MAFRREYYKKPVSLPFSLLRASPSFSPSLFYSVLYFLACFLFPLVLFFSATFSLSKAVIYIVLEGREIRGYYWKEAVSLFILWLGLGFQLHRLTYTGYELFLKDSNQHSCYPPMLWEVTRHLFLKSDSFENRQLLYHLIILTSKFTWKKAHKI